MTQEVADALIAIVDAIVAWETMQYYWLWGLSIGLGGVLVLVTGFAIKTTKKFKKMENRIEMLESHMAGWYKAKEDE